MASTFSPILRIELMGTGDQSGSWGSTTNVNLGTLIEQAIAGTAVVDVTAGNVTLTNFNGTTDQARCMALRITGTPGSSRNVVAPAVSKSYIIANGSNGAVVLKTSLSTGLTVPAGEVYLAFYDTTTNDFRLVGRASSSANTANTLVLRDASGNFSAGMITANLTGNVTGNVTGTLTGTIATTTVATTQAVTDDSTKVATTAYVRDIIPTGVIVMWSGSIASVPSGWLLCDGTNGTPDLRNRFVVGAGSTYAVDATGGSANAIVVAHTHTATVTDPGHNHQACISNFGQATGGPGGSGSSTYGTNCNNVTGTRTTGISVTNSTTGSSGTNANLPPYYALAYIMKA